VGIDEHDLKKGMFSINMFVEHPLIKGEIESRLYQEEILGSIKGQNTLVVLPTGLGKTPLALLVAVGMLEKNKKVLFMAPTRPLVDQHKKYFDKTLGIESVLLTGRVAPAKRSDLWKNQLVFATPQVVENDILARRFKLDEFGLIVFDEAHRSVGDYAYVFIAKQFHGKSLLLGLTASPGADDETIRMVCSNLFVKNVQVRDEEDKSVKPYVHEVRILWEKVDLPQEFQEIKSTLEDCLRDYLRSLRAGGFIPSADLKKVRRRDLITLQGKIGKMISDGDKTRFRGASIVASAIKVEHALELLETQGVSSLRKYFGRLKTQKSKASRMLFAGRDFMMVVQKVESLYERKIEHPKVVRLREVVRREMNSNPNALILVFTQYRDSVDMIVRELEDEFMVEKLVGQGERIGKGMTQKRQVEVLENFKARKFNVLVATSVGEEGLDIGNMDTVIFFEPITSAVRNIQRRGRTARQRAGKVIVMMTRGTRDEGYYWAARHREANMKKILKKIGKGKLDLGKQKKLGEF